MLNSFWGLLFCQCVTPQTGLSTLPRAEDINEITADCSGCGNSSFYREDILRNGNVYYDWSEEHTDTGVQEVYGNPHEQHCIYSITQQLPAHRLALYAQESVANRYHALEPPASRLFVFRTKKGRNG